MVAKPFLTSTAGGAISITDNAASALEYSLALNRGSSVCVCHRQLPNLSLKEEQ